MKCYIIAEAGVNHNGNLDVAKKMVDKAKEAGADCIKFQTFIAENLVIKEARKAEYQKKETGAEESQYDMLKKLELSFDDFKELKNYCNLKDIDFLSTAFDFESIEFLNSIGMDKWKIPSGEVTNLPYLIEITKTCKPIIISTGMCTYDEVNQTIEILKKRGCNDITVMQCTTEYPAPYSNVNLHAMNMMKKELNVPVGYSDHTLGIEVAIAAVALGAQIIEKHFTLDKNMSGPDHKASIEPVELKKMVESIRNVESALGEYNKVPNEVERMTADVVRKSIVAKCKIKKGERLTSDNLTVKRPGSGINPMRWFEVVNQEANRDYEEDELIEI